MQSLLSSCENRLSRFIHWAEVGVALVARWGLGKPFTTTLQAFVALPSIQGGLARYLYLGQVLSGVGKEVEHLFAFRADVGVSSTARATAETRSLTQPPRRRSCR